MIFGPARPEMSISAWGHHQCDPPQPVAQEQAQIVEERPATMAAKGTASEGPVPDGGEVAIVLPSGQVCL